MYSNNVSKIPWGHDGKGVGYTVDDEETHRNERSIGNLKAEWLAQLSPTTRTMMLNDYNAGHPVLGQVPGGVVAMRTEQKQPACLVDSLTHRPSYRSLFHASAYRAADLP